MQELLNTEMIPDKRTGRRLLEMPDLEAYGSAEDASFDNVQEAMTRILERAEMFPPEPYMGLDGLIEALKIANQTFLKARMQTLPEREKKLEMLIAYMDKCTQLIAEAKAANAPPPDPAAQGGIGPRIAHDVQRMTAHQAAQQLTGT